jgi:hypothetical protein
MKDNNETNFFIKYNFIIQPLIISIFLPFGFYISIKMLIYELKHNERSFILKYLIKEYVEEMKKNNIKIIKEITNNIIEDFKKSN